MRILTVIATFEVPDDPEAAADVLSGYKAVKSALGQTMARVETKDTGPKREARRWRSEETRRAAQERAKLYLRRKPADAAAQ